MTFRSTRSAILALGLALPVAAGLLIEPAAAQGPAKSYLYGQKRFGRACPPPLKYAAGACVRRCPAGYKTDGRYCRMRGGGF